MNLRLTRRNRKASLLIMSHAKQSRDLIKELDANVPSEGRLGESPRVNGASVAGIYEPTCTHESAKHDRRFQSSELSESAKSSEFSLTSERGFQS